MEKINAAVVGLGRMGKNHARVLSTISSVKLFGVCDVDESVAKNVAKKYRTSYYLDYKELAEERELDVVIIATPTSLHKTVACEFIKNNKHVLVEKPIATNVRDAQEIVRLAEVKNVKLMVGHVERFNPAVNRLKEVIDRGDIGDIISIQAKRIGPHPPRNIDVGVTIDLAIHDIDIIANYILERRKIRRIYAVTRSVFSEYSDIVHALIKFEGDVIASLTANWLTPTKIRKLEAIGDKGFINLDYISQNIQLLRKYEEVHQDVYLESENIFVKKEEPLKRELVHFINTIIHDEQPPLTGQDAVNALKIAEEIEKISKSELVGVRYEELG